MEGREGVHSGNNIPIKGIKSSTKVETEITFKLSYE